MNLEKYTIAEEGILSKLKAKFTSKSSKKRLENNTIVNNNSYGRNNNFDVRLIPKEVLDKEIELRRKEYLMCSEFFHDIFKNKKYFKDPRILKNTSFVLQENKLIKTNKILYSDCNNIDNDAYDYFYSLAKYENFYSIWADIGIISIGDIELDTDIIQDDPSLDSFQESCNNICLEFENFLKNRKFKCIKNYAADGLEDFCLALSIDIGPSDEFLKQIEFYKKIKESNNLENRKNKITRYTERKEQERKRKEELESSREYIRRGTRYDMSDE